MSLEMPKMNLTQQQRRRAWRESCATFTSTLTQRWMTVTAISKKCHAWASCLQLTPPTRWWYFDDNNNITLLLTVTRWWSFCHLDKAPSSKDSESNGILFMIFMCSPTKVKMHSKLVFQLSTSTSDISELIAMIRFGAGFLCVLRYLSTYSW